jgi:hypothetical protein
VYLDCLPLLAIYVRDVTGYIKVLNELHNVAIHKKSKMHKIPVGWQKSTLCGLKVNSNLWESFVGSCILSHVVCKRCAKIMEKYKGN